MDTEKSIFLNPRELRAGKVNSRYEIEGYPWRDTG